MLNRSVSSWRQSRRHSGGVNYTSISRTPSQTTGIRKHWRTFGLGARSILCICAESHIDPDYYTTTGADAPCPLGEGALLVVSNCASRPRPEKANTSRETELAWFEKTARRLRLRSEPGAAVKKRQRKKTGARADRGDEDDQSYDNDDDNLHHHMARLHLITPSKTAATGERIQATPSISSDDDTDTLMSANLREDEPGGAQVTGKLSPSLQEEEEGRPENEEKSDAAWEALKRRVLYVEEHGGSPLDMSDGNDAERALRELRAQLRRGWAEEVMRMRAQEENSRSTKKRRRNAGQWTCENGDLLQCTVTVSETPCEKRRVLPTYHLSSTRMLSRAPPFIDGQQLHKFRVFRIQ